MSQPRIAIVGAGIAGLSAAWRLREVADVTVFDRRSWAGGAVHTVDIEVDGQKIGADMGVILAQPFGYPNLYTLMEGLHAGTEISNVSLGASFGDGEAWWQGDASALSPHPSGLWGRLVGEVSRFLVEVFRFVNQPSPDPSETLGGFLDRHGFSHEFRRRGLLPIMFLVTSMRTGLFDMPMTTAASVFQAFPLSFSAPNIWRRFKGGTSVYIDRLIEPFRRSILLERTVLSVTRTDGGVELAWQHGHDGPMEHGHFDQVILATEADVALRLLRDPSKREQEILGMFRYESAETYLHSDESFLCSDLPRSLFVQYLQRHAGEDPVFTFNLNVALDLPAGTKPVLVTNIIGGQRAPRKETWYAPMACWRHVVQDQAAVQAAARLHEIQGHQRTWYAGTSVMILSSHEVSLVSGLVIADALGAPYPFAAHPVAKQMYDAVRMQMLKGT